VKPDGSASPLTIAEIAVVNEYGTEDGRIPAIAEHVTSTRKTAEEIRKALADLPALLEEHRGALPAGASTADVVALVIKPATAGAPQLSYAEQLWMQRSCGTSGRAFVGPARAFVSHAWSNSFEDLVETLEAHSRSAAPQAAELGAAADGDEVLYFWVGAPPRARALLVS
jgi:hypothetical protein